MSPSGSPFLKIRAIAMECSGWTERGHVSGVLLLRASNSMQYREGHEVFSTVTCPVECGTGDPSGSVNKLVLRIKHSSNESLTL